MKLRKLTHNDAGVEVAPRSSEDRRGWNRWVSASKLRGYLLGGTLGDWLHLHGEKHGFEPDPPTDERLDLRRLNFRQGQLFERRVAEYLGKRADLVRITRDGMEGQDPKKAAATFRALEAGREIVHGGVLWNPQTRTWGVPDFLIRSDVFARLFPGHPDPYGEPDAGSGAAKARYVVVDAKFRTIPLGTDTPRKGSRSAPGEVGKGGSLRAYRGQLFLYNEALARIQGEAPRVAFLLGRRWKRTQRKKRHYGAHAMERLGPVSMTSELADSVQRAVRWVRRLRTEGRQWRVLPAPSEPELRPPRPNDAEWPWKTAIRQITAELEDPIRVLEVGAKGRDAAAAKGITSWRDPRATATALGVRASMRPKVDRILKVNRTDGPVVRPRRVAAGGEQWRARPPVEFFVDFENVTNVIDDFSRFPRIGGEERIFMIGCGHAEAGEWRFRCFIADRLNAAGEAKIVDSWIRHMRSVGRRLGATGTPRAFHWSRAESDLLKRAGERHNGRGWADSADFVWFDLLSQVVRAQPVVVRGAFGFGLKEVANALHGHGLIETAWGDSEVDGQGAMVGAWHCDREAEEKGIRLEDTELMRDIRRYNKVDCKVMWQILEYLREHH